jgi:hypothetical protein
MKLNPISIRQPISNTVLDLNKPNPPTAEAIKKAQFVDKTYQWKNAGVRPGDRRPSK